MGFNPAWFWAICVALVLLAVDLLMPRRKTFGHICLVLAVLCFLAGAVGMIYGWTHPGRSDVGVLVVHRTFLDRLLFRYHPISAFADRMVEIGSSGTKFVMFDNSQVHEFFDTMKLSLQKHGDQLVVSARIMDRTGKRAIAIIKSGQWQAIEHETTDFNYTDDTLEVKNAADQVVLQLRLLPNRIQIQGEAWDSTGQGIRLVTCHEPGTGRPGGCEMLLTPTYDPDEPHIESLCAYPSSADSNLGRCLNSDPSPIYSENRVMLVFVGFYALLVFSGPIVLFLIRRTADA